MNYYRHYRKCAFSGRLLFDQDRPLIEAQSNVDALYFVDADHRAAFHESWPLAEVAERFAAWQRPVPPEIGRNIDPITLEVINNALVSVVSQMAETMARTAYSPVFAEARDFTCALFDADLELVAQHRGLPAQIGSLRYCVPWAIKKVGAENLRPSDIIVHNDPQVGAPHLPEVCVIRPIFVEGRIGLYAATIAHQTDIGGVAPGSMPGDAREIYQEGLVIPPIKLFEEGRESASVFQMILGNVRSPESMYGDISAMCGSLIIAERAMGDLSRRHGWDLLFRYMSELKDYAERRFRAEIAKLPSGIYHGRAVVDDDGVMPGEHVIKLALAVRDDSIIADFRGTATQSRGPINCTYSVTCAATLNAILHILGGELLNNEGLHRAVHVIAPPGTIVNVNHPGAYNSGQTETHNLLVETFMNALINVVPARCAAPSASTTCLVTGGAWHPSKRETYTFVTWDNAGTGALINQDGNTAMSRYVGTTGKNYPTEVLESQFPWHIHRLELRTDSAGAGKQRGGLGVVREYELRAPELEFGVNSNRGRFPPQGVFGGGAAKPTRYWIQRNGKLVDPIALGEGIISPDKFSGVRLTAGQRFVVETPGGGGWGDPKTRDRAKVEDDLKQGYITRDQAVEIYGLDPHVADQIVETCHWKRA